MNFISQSESDEKSESELYLEYFLESSFLYFRSSGEVDL
jgi:hypothetical protein